MKEIARIQSRERAFRTRRAEELTDLWLSGNHKQRQEVLVECMAAPGIMAVVACNMLAEDFTEAHEFLDQCGDLDAI